LGHGGWSAKKRDSASKEKKKVSHEKWDGQKEKGRTCENFLKTAAGGGEEERLGREAGHNLVNSVSGRRAQTAELKPNMACECRKATTEGAHFIYLEGPGPCKSPANKMGRRIQQRAIFRALKEAGAVLVTRQGRDEERSPE